MTSFLAPKKAGALVRPADYLSNNSAVERDVTLSATHYVPFEFYGYHPIGKIGFYQDEDSGPKIFPLAFYAAGEDGLPAKLVHEIDIERYDDLTLDGYVWRDREYFSSRDSYWCTLKLEEEEEYIALSGRFWLAFTNPNHADNPIKMMSYRSKVDGFLPAPDLTVASAQATYVPILQSFSIPSSSGLPPFPEDVSELTFLTQASSNPEVVITVGTGEWN